MCGLLGATAGPPNPECSASWTSLPRSTSLAPVLVCGRGRQRSAHPLQHRLRCRPPGGLEDTLRAFEKRLDHVALSPKRSLELDRIAPAEELGLSLAQSLACRHERTHLHGLSAGQLVHGPGRKRRLRERLHLGGRLLLAGLPQLAGEVVSAPRELFERKSVKPVELVVG